MAPRQLEHLAAQRQLYSTAKRIYLIQFALSVPLAVIWAIAILAHPPLKAFAAWWGLFVMLLDLLYSAPQQKRLRQQAAAIQELFDCEVLGMEWKNLKAGAKPSPETVADAAERYRRKEPDYGPLKDWYPASVSKVPLALGRVICQRCNCWWDLELRRRYATWSAWTTAVIVGGVIVLGLLRRLTLEEMALGIITPILPVLIFGLREYRDNSDTASSLQRLHAHVDGLWKKALAGSRSAEQMEQDSRELQDEIFDLRRRSPFIADQIYERLKSGQEKLMMRGADELVSEALDHQNP